MWLQLKLVDGTSANSGTSFQAQKGFRKTFPPLPPVFPRWFPPMTLPWICTRIRVSLHILSPVLGVPLLASQVLLLHAESAAGHRLPGADGAPPAALRTGAAVHLRPASGQRAELRFRLAIRWGRGQRSCAPHPTLTLNLPHPISQRKLGSGHGFQERLLTPFNVSDLKAVCIGCE